jgi:hypothetical protein
MPDPASATHGPVITRRYHEIAAATSRWPDISDNVQ